MGFFDKLIHSAESTAKNFARDVGSDLVNAGLGNAKCTSVPVQGMPASLAEFQAMDGADFKDPNKVVALTVVALCAYPHSKDLCISMLNHLKGPSPLSAYETQFLGDRFRGKDYLAISYLAGATPQNNYTPSEPYTIHVYETSHSHDMIGEGYLQLYLKSGGADTARPVRLRKKESTGEWFLWEYFLLPDIRKPTSADPWA